MHKQSSDSQSSGSSSESEHTPIAPIPQNISSSDNTSSTDDNQTSPMPQSTESSSHTLSSGSSSSSPESTTMMPFQSLEETIPLDERQSSKDSKGKAPIVEPPPSKHSKAIGLSDELDNVNLDFSRVMSKHAIDPPKKYKLTSSGGRFRSQSAPSEEISITKEPVQDNPAAQMIQNDLQLDTQHRQYPQPVLINNEEDDSCGVNCFKNFCKYIHNVIDIFANTIWVPIASLPSPVQPVVQIILTPILSNIVDLHNQLIYRTPFVTSINKDEIVKHITCRGVSLAITASTGVLVGVYGPTLGAGWIESENGAVQFVGLLFTDPNFRQPFFYTIGYFGNLGLQKMSLALWDRCGPKKNVVPEEDPQELNSLQQLMRNSKRAVTVIAAMKNINKADSYFSNGEYSVLLISGCVLALDFTLKALSFIGFYDNSALRLKLPAFVEEQFESCIDQAKTLSSEKTPLKNDKKNYRGIEEETADRDAPEYTEEQLITHGGIVRGVSNIFYYGAAFAWSVIIHETYADLYKDTPESFFAMSYGVPVVVRHLIDNVNEIKTEVITLGKNVMSNCCSVLFHKKQSINEPGQSANLAPNRPQL